MQFSSLLIKSLSFVLFSIFISSTAFGQSPLLPFPAQPPIAQISAQPFLQPDQVIVGPASVIQAIQRTYVEQNSQAPTLTPLQTAPLQIVVSEHELLAMDLKREMAYQNRIQRHVQTTRDINNFVSMMTQNLGSSGWYTSWQGIRNSTGTYVTDFYQTGGQHLRLEVKNSNTGSYKVLLYTF